MLDEHVAALYGIEPEMQFIQEISANKYALNIRFAIFGDDARPHTSSSNVEFELTLCNL